MKRRDVDLIAAAERFNDRLDSRRRRYGAGHEGLEQEELLKPDLCGVPDRTERDPPLDPDRFVESVEREARDRLAGLGYPWRWAGPSDIRTDGYVEIWTVIDEAVEPLIGHRRDLELLRLQQAARKRRDVAKGKPEVEVERIEQEFEKAAAERRRRWKQESRGAVGDDVTARRAYNMAQVLEAAANWRDARRRATDTGGDGLDQAWLFTAAFRLGEVVTQARVRDRDTLIKKKGGQNGRGPQKSVVPVGVDQLRDDVRAAFAEKLAESRRLGLKGWRTEVQRKLGRRFRLSQSTVRRWVLDIK